MAVKLRLRRMGKKRQPVYKVVAADARSPRDGKFIEQIGIYNPKSNPATVSIDEDRALYWLNCGAQPTETVKGLLSKRGLLLKKELLKKGLSESEVTAKLDEWNKLQEAKKSSRKEIANKIKEEKIEAKEVTAPEVKGTTSDEESAKEGSTEET